MNNGKLSTFLITAVCFVIAFLYIPIFMLIAYSFNYSKLVPVWGGFSVRWYEKLLFDSPEIWDAVVLNHCTARHSATQHYNITT